jgi:hypothetical protein
VECEDQSYDKDPYLNKTLVSTNPIMLVRKNNSKFVLYSRMSKNATVFLRSRSNILSVVSQVMVLGCHRKENAVVSPKHMEFPLALLTIGGPVGGATAVSFSAPKNSGMAENSQRLRRETWTLYYLLLITRLSGSRYTSLIPTCLTS